MQENIEYPESCMNCAYWGKSQKIKRHNHNSTKLIDVIIGSCFNDSNKITFIHTGEKSASIITQGNFKCDKFQKRVKHD